MSFKTIKSASINKVIKINAVFPMPFIDDVTVNGGLNYLALRADPTADVIVHCGPISIALPGDSIDLYWKGSDGNERLVATRPIIGEEIMVSLSIRVAEVLLAKEGLGSLYYNFVDSFGNAIPSDDMPCLIKTTVPGNPYSAGNLPETIYINEAMLVATVTPLAIDKGNIAQGATVTIPAWSNMFEGDVVTLNWGGYPIRQPALTAAQVGQPLVIQVTETDIRNAGNADELPVSYEVRDIVNNWSLNAAATLINVDTDLTLLDAPDVIDANDGVLDHDELTAPSPVMVKTPGPVFTVNDTVTLYWKGTNAQGALIEKSYELKVTGTNPSSRLKFNVPEDDVALFVGGTTTVASYTLTPAATGIPLPSRTVMFAVIGTQVKLPAPTLENGLVDGVFEPATLPVTGAQISLPAYPGMAKDDRVFLSWKGNNSEGDPLNGSDDQTLEDSDVDKQFVFVIGKDNFSDFGDATELTFSYTVIFAGTGGTRDSDERTYTVKIPVAQQPPAPSVVEASGDVLNPMNAAAGATLRVRYDGMLDTDIIGINWNGDGNFPNKPGNRALGYVDFMIDVPRIAPTLGKTIVAFYSVGRNGGYDMSLNLPLQVLEFQNPTVELPTPDVIEEVAGVLDLGIFDGDAHITVAPWPLISVGQKYWISVIGTLAQDSSPYTIVVAQGEVVSLAEKTAGLNGILVRTELDKLLDNSTFTVQLRVLFDSNGVEGNAVLFPVLNNIKIVKKLPWLDDITDFTYGQNGWVLGPASSGGVFNGRYFANTTNSNGDFSGVIMYKDFTLIQGRSYYLSVNVGNHTGASGAYNPHIQIGCYDAVSNVPAIPRDGVEHVISITFRATIASQRVFIQNLTPSGNGNDYVIADPRVKQLS
ncbi:hypothetical protein ACJJU9_03280 [Pseudomonas helleri]|uniref:hypothetical protein n=1 Tax=Pseudomonas helleri TaxID=1608996 RepID=UPI00389A61B7